MTASLRLALALSLGLGLASGCACGPRTQADGGTPVEDAGFDAGQPVEDAGFDAGEPDAGPPPELKIRKVLPPRGPTGGGTPVTLQGQGFIRGFSTRGTEAKTKTTLRFGANAVIDYQIIDDETLELRAPPGAVGPVAVAMTNPNGQVLCSGCFTYYDEVVLTGLNPREGPLAGGNEVVLSGQGFTPDVQVLFGNLSSPLITYVGPTQLKAIAPRGLAADAVDVTVYSKNGVGFLRRAYTYLGELQLTGLSPASSPLAGGVAVTLTGQAFTGATEVRFGATPGTALSVASGTQLTVTVPAAATAGAVDVTIVTPKQSRTFKRAFTYYDAAGAFAVLGVFPRLGVPGQQVTVTGQGLDAAGLTVTLGGEPAAVVGTPTFSEAVVTVPARGAAPRVSDVAANDTTSTQTLAAAFTWRVALGSITPTSGPQAGGAAAAVVGLRLPPDARVWLGALEASGVTVTGESMAALTTPRGAGGAASDVVVREAADPENEAVLPGAYTFLETLQVGRVQPDRGAIAGNTLVTVLGAGFGDSTVVTFGTLRAKDVKVIDSHTLTCRTPRGTVGTVDVRVDRLTENDVLPGGFSYFDPRSISGGVSGGPLVGTLNVTVLDSTQGFYGAPVANATVMLGLDPATPFQGLTDSRGQLTFSDPSLVKAQTVTVTKEFYESVTVTSVASENLTVFVARTGGGDGSPGLPPPGPPPSVISGKVTGFKAPRPLTATEKLEARVFVAQTSLYAGPPFSGVPNKSREKWQVATEGGEYLVFTGAGLRATYAVLGIIDTVAQTFTPYLMGVRRGITTSPDQPATNQNIILDMHLDLTVPVVIDSPLTEPGTLGPEPMENAVYAWLDLGAEGFIPNPNNWATGTQSRTTVRSSTPNLQFPHFPRLDGSNFIFLNESASVQGYPVSYYFRRQPGSMATGVTIGPMLPTPRLSQPSATFTGTISWSVDPGPSPDIHQVQILKPTMFGMLTLWSMVLPGSERQVVVPQTAVDKLRSEEQGPLFAVVYSSRSPKFSYNQWTYDTLSGVTWSSFTIALSQDFVP